MTGIEPASSAWKAEVLAITPHLQIKRTANPLLCLQYFIARVRLRNAFNFWGDTLEYPFSAELFKLKCAHYEVRLNFKGKRQMTKLICMKVLYQISLKKSISSSKIFFNNFLYVCYHFKLKKSRKNDNKKLFISFFG